MNEWVELLRAECARTSQAEAARRLGISATTVNRVLKGAYNGDVRKVKARVEGLLMGATVECPVVGEMPRNRCAEYQGRRFAATNPMRVALSQACRTCPNNGKGAA